MSLLFPNLGFEDSSGRTLALLEYQVAENGLRIATRKRTYYWWSPGAGIELWVKANAKGELGTVHPYFSGTSRMCVGLTKKTKRANESYSDGGFVALTCPYTTGGKRLKGRFAFVFDVPDYYRYEGIKLRKAYYGQFVAFAIELTAYESREAYLAAQEGKDGWWDSQSFRSAIYFKEDKNEPDVAVPPIAAITGHVMCAEIRTNPITGCDFSWAEICTIGGDMDIVVAPKDLDGYLVKGGVVSGSFYLMGCLITGAMNSYFYSGSVNHGRPEREFCGHQEP
jgi:hypothetical protein